MEKREKERWRRERAKEVKRTRIREKGDKTALHYQTRTLQNPAAWLRRTSGPLALLGAGDSAKASRRTSIRDAAMAERWRE